MAALLAPAAAASFFEIHLAVGRHQHAHHDRRPSPSAFSTSRAGSDAERLGRLHADAVGIRVVVVFMQGEGDAGLAQRDVAGVPLAMVENCVQHTEV